MSAFMVDEALDQWNSLVEREEKAAYKILPSSSRSSTSALSEQQQQEEDGRHEEQQQPRHIMHSCPSDWREKICEWCFQVVDHVNIDRDAVSIALSYFDRYLSCHTSVPETMFQLVAMTSLYLAVKLHSTRKISVSSMSALSKGHFRVDQILKMEGAIINTLGWHLNPPTPSTYLDIINPIIEASVININNVQASSYEISELSRYLVELSVCDGYFADKRPSSIAYASVLVAMEHLSTSTKVEQRLSSYHLDMSPCVTEQCAQRIHQVYRLANSSGEEESDVPARAGSSPTSVLSPCA